MQCAMMASRKLIHDDRVDEITHIPLQTCNFPDDAGRQEGIFLRRRYENRFDLGSKVAVHSSNLYLVLKVRDGSQATHDHPAANLLGIIHQQAAE